MPIPSGCDVLIVTRDNALASALEALMRAEGIARTCAVVPDGSEALHQLAAADKDRTAAIPEAVVIDWRDVESGLSFIRTLRAFPDTHDISVLGVGATPDGLSQDIDGAIRLPLSRESLLQALREAEMPIAGA